MDKKLEPSIFDWMTKYNSGPDSIDLKKVEEFKKELKETIGVKVETKKTK